jgi:L-asparaginase
VRIKVFTVGGTIDKIYFDAKSEYEVGESLLTEILGDANICFEYSIEPVMKKDSLDMDDNDRALLKRKVAAASEDRVLITHGTDTMVLSAQALSDLKDKTIVFTGALKPARFRDSDATFNVGFALGALQTLPPGVYIAMNGQVLNPANTRKVREHNRFEAS